MPSMHSIMFRAARRCFNPYGSPTSWRCDRCLVSILCMTRLLRQHPRSAPIFEPQREPAGLSMRMRFLNWRRPMEFNGSHCHGRRRSCPASSISYVGNSRRWKRFVGAPSTTTICLATAQEKFVERTSRDCITALRRLPLACLNSMMQRRRSERLTTFPTYLWGAMIAATSVRLFPGIRLP